MYMPRKNRITEPGYYHVISRDVEKHNIFLKIKIITDLRYLKSIV